MVIRKTYINNSIFVTLFVAALFCVFLPGCTHKEEEVTKQEEVIIAHDFTQKSGGMIQDIRRVQPLYFDPYTQLSLGDGWASPETAADGTSYIWSLGKSSQVRFAVAEPRDLTVTMHCFPLKVENQQQRITIAVNAQDVTTIPLDRDDGFYAFTIPKTCLTSGENTMTFTYAYARIPQSLNINNDVRELAVRFSRVDFIPGRSGDSVVTMESVNHLVQISRMKIGNEMKIGIMQRPQSAIVFDKCYIPPRAALKFALGFHPQVKTSDTDVTFSVVVKEFTPFASQASDGQTIFAETLNLQRTRDRVWKNYTVDLAAFAGKVVSMAFQLESQADPQTMLAFWGEPKIYANVRDPQYNVILITLDALRSDHVGCYGYPKNTTPNIDAFAREAVKFTQCYATAPWTLPSFASYYTALYPQTHKAFPILDRRFPTPPIFLKPYGYFTQIITIPDHPYFNPKFGLPNAFDHKDSDSLNQTMPFYIDNIQKWLKQHAEEKFFLHLHIFPPHDPYMAVAPYDETFLDFNISALKLFYIHHSDRFAPWSGDEFWKHEITDANIRRSIVNLYDAGLALADEFLGKIITQIKTFGLYDETLIIVASDHGEQFWDHGQISHGSSLYNEELHVPLLVKFPKVFQLAPTQNDVPVLTIDILPTILAVNGIPVPEYFQGQSFFNLEQKKLQNVEREYGYFAQLDRRFLLQGVRRQNYQYIASGVKKTEELYDLASDPTEQQNLAAKYPEIVEQLRAALANFQTNVAAATPAQGAPEVDADTLKRLKDLGYVQ
jgi:arylsulfatase A-like enzyme